MKQDTFEVQVVQKHKTNDGVEHTQDFERHVNFNLLPNNGVFAYPRSAVNYPINESSERARQESGRHKSYPVPSLRCFQDAAEYAYNAPFGGYKIVHAKIGHDNFHAWVETNNKIIESHWMNGQLWYFIYPKKYRFAMTTWVVLRQVKYSRKQILKLMESTQECGPWEKFMLEDIVDDETERQRLLANHEDMFAQLQAHAGERR